MPRRARLDGPGWLHHVMARGIERRPIFLDDRDCRDFLARLERLTREGALTVYAWALMWNHFHLLCRTGNRSLSRAMSSLLTGYAGAFNRRHGRVGHLFQNRFKSVVCDEAGYFRELVRYIHLNPVRAEIVPGVDELDRYPWTGHAAVMGNAPARMLDVERVLSAFGPSPADARASYRRFLAEGLEPAEQETTRKGRSWKHLAFLARQVRKAVRDQRVFGSAEFLAMLASPASPEERGALPPDPPPGIGLPDLVSLVARSCGTTPGLIRSGRKLPACTLAREGIGHLWLDVFGGECQALVPFFGVGEPAIYKAAHRGRRNQARWAALLTDAADGATTDERRKEAEFDSNKVQS